MSKPRVFVTQPIAESALARLRAVAEVEVNTDSSQVLPKDQLIASVKRADILMCLLHDTVDRDVLTANPNLKAVSSMNITQDRIDLAAATRRGIPVTNIPAIVTDATADMLNSTPVIANRPKVRLTSCIRPIMAPSPNCHSNRNQM